ncbi:MAG: Flp pilus assembly complex ATPase component TadA [Pseudobacteriovorax sp.]|nr:Flp pilus assembly complex ATPase component TadA [Pseudobacteriovorax sp.]
MSHHNASLSTIIRSARQKGASDVHLDCGLPPALRVDGKITFLDEAITATKLNEWVIGLLGPDRWEYLQERKSIDLSEIIGGLRCRLNIFFSLRGVSLAIRILYDHQVSIDSMNLHPIFKEISTHRQGLILVCGSTGSGKSTTLAALVHEMNLRESLNIITIENPIEYVMKPIKSMIRQREVGISVDTFFDGVRDALREDPDVIMVGEIRDGDTARATLRAADTGHLVLGTLHGSNCTEALQRMTSLCQSEQQEGVLHQLAGCLKAVISQKLVYLPERKMRVPLCEILIPNTATKSVLHSNQLVKIQDTLASGRDNGSLTFKWYQDWLDAKTNFHYPKPSEPPAESSETIESGQKDLWKLATKKTRSGKQTMKQSQSDLEITDDGEDLMDIIQDLER